jgi:hypothetical protein
VASAQTATVSAHQDVRQVLATTPPPQIAAPLTAADGKLLTAIAQQATVLGELKEKQQAITAGEQGRLGDRQKLQTENAALRAAAVQYKEQSETRFRQQAEASAAKISELEEANKELQDEVNRRARTWLMFIGIGFLVAAGCGFAARFYFGFGLGTFIGTVGAVVGPVCLTLAAYLQTIELIVLIGLSVGAVGLLGWGIWRAVKHVPVTRKRDP